jgi:tetratricopeptide (TPR) repeat protein
MEKNSQSFQIYNFILKEDPQNLDALIGKGTLFHAKSKFFDAIECYDIALKAKPRFAMALAYKGMSLGELGKLDYALTCFKKALTIDKDYDLANMGKQKALELLKSQKTKK